MKALDVAHVNPFLQSSLSVIEMTTQIKAAVGKPSLAKLDFPGMTFVLRVGVTGVLKGQVLLVFTEDNAKMFASKMMMGMPVNQLDEMASSALCELSNMIMGNTATLFAAKNIPMDITPPISLYGQALNMSTAVQSLRIPIMENGKELFAILLCIAEE